MCVYSLKNTVQYYRQHNSPVFGCFLDASKANYWCLFSKLIKRGVPLLIVRILVYWYTTQQCVIQVIQCVLPRLMVSAKVAYCHRDYSLCIYMILAMFYVPFNVGCFIDNTCTNNYFYADDMCLLAPSAGGLQKLIDACSKYGNEHKILFYLSPKTLKVNCSNCPFR